MSDIGEEYGKAVREVFHLAHTICGACIDYIDTWCPNKEDLDNMDYAAHGLTKILADYFGIRRDEI